MIISKTPMRISFAGGGSDFQAYYRNGHGAVLSAAIDKYVYVMVNRKFDDYIRISYSMTELVHSVDDIQHNLIREAIKLVGGIGTGIDITYMADVLPMEWGTGLGVSSSITVGVLNALFKYKGQDVGPEELARLACRIEIDILGAPIGKQDQYAAAYGGLNYIQFNADESVEIHPVAISEPGQQKMQDSLILMYTELNSDSAVVLGEQRSNISQNSATVSILDTMVTLAKTLQNNLEANQITQLGHTLHTGWLAKQKLASRISNPQIDAYYQIALDNGAVGGKILGSGGGGFLLFYCEPDRQAQLQAALPGLKPMIMQVSSTGSEIIYFANGFKH